MSAARKKVVVRLLTGDVQWGYLPASELAPSGEAELLLPDGRLMPLPLAGVKYIAFVRDFNLDDPVDPERLGPRSFTSRPRGDGLWIRVLFSDGEYLEGLASSGLSFLDSLLTDQGLFLEPPDRRGNTLRLVVPRSALAGFEMLGVVGRTSAARKPVSRPGGSQGGLFDETAQS